jgi:hypothetical protein
VVSYVFSVVYFLCLLGTALSFFTLLPPTRRNWAIRNNNNNNKHASSRLLLFHPHAGGRFASTQRAGLRVMWRWSAPLLQTSATRFTRALAFFARCPPRLTCDHAGKANSGKNKSHKAIQKEITCGLGMYVGVRATRSALVHGDLS